MPVGGGAGDDVLSAVVVFFSTLFLNGEGFGPSLEVVHIVSEVLNPSVIRFIGLEGLVGFSFSPTRFINY